MIILLINYNVREWFSTVVGVMNNEQKNLLTKKIQKKIQGRFMAKIHRCSRLYIIYYTVYKLYSADKF